MVDDAILVFVDKLHGIFNRDDVAFFPVVDVVDHGRERSRLTATRGPCDQHYAFMKHGQLGNNRRQSQLFHRQYLTGNFPEDRPDPPLLLKIIGPIARQIGDFIGKVNVAGFFKDLDFVFGGDLVQDGFQLVVLEFLVLDAFHIPVHPENRLRARHQVEIGGALFIHQLKKSVYFCHVKSL